MNPPPAPGDPSRSAVTSLGWLWRPLGGERSQIVWRAYGWAVVLFGLMKFVVMEPWAYWAHYPGSFHLLIASGLLLLLGGPRLVPLAAAALSAPLAWWSVVLRTDPTLWFPAADWPLLAGYPVLGCIALLVTRRDPARSGEQLDRAGAAAVRAMGGIALFAAAFHKLNYDFLDRTVSCVYLREGLLGWWGVPRGLVELVTPESILVLELGGALILWLAPRLASVLVGLLMLQFGSLGATTFAGLILTAAAAGLPAGTWAAAKRYGQRYRWYLLGGLVALLVASAVAYRGPRPWSQFAVFHTGAIAIIGLGVASLTLPRRRPRAAPLLPEARLFLAAVVLAATFNAARPYLGLGFQYSFAMLSNLRVDSDRWNSLLVPRPASLETDGYLHVYGVRYFPEKPENPPILPALHSPGGIKLKLALLIRDGYWAGLDFEYRGRAYRFSDGERRELMSALLLSMPDEPLLQEELVLGGPQICVH